MIFYDIKIKFYLLNKNNFKTKISADNNIGLEKPIPEKSCQIDRSLVKTRDKKRDYEKL